MKIKKMLFVVLAMVMLLSSLTTMAYAKDYTASQGGPSSGRVCTVSKTILDRSSWKKKYIPNTGIEHKKGRTESVQVTKGDGCSTEITVGYEATIGGEFMGITAEATAKAGVSNSVSYTQSSTRTFPLAKNDPSGLYRARVIFPKYRTHIVITDYSPNYHKTRRDEKVNLGSKKDAAVGIYCYLQY